MDPHVNRVGKNQKLYGMLKAQYYAEREELIRYVELLGGIQNSIVRNYLRTLLGDGLKHIEYISKMMSDFEGASRSASLTSDGIKESISHERESKEILKECLEMADMPEAKSILTSIIVDEEHHIKILEHMDDLVQSYSK